MLALEGIKLLDLTWQGPGPLGTMILGDLGAEVIRISAPPSAGVRQVMRENGRREAIFTAGNRNKKSILLNLKSDEGRRIFHKLASDADAVVEGFRPGVAKRLGIDYAAIGKINPRIIYCSITGYGQDGPYRDLAGHDINYISFAGVLGLVGERGGKPIVPSNFVADYGAGAKDAAIGILTALIARGKTGKGQYIDISLTDSSITLLTNKANAYFKDGVAPKRGENFVSGAFPYYTVYETKDGKYLSVGCLEPWLWEHLCQAIGKEELIPSMVKDGRIVDNMNDENLEKIRAQLEKVFLTRTRDEWFDLLSAKDVAVGKVYSLDEVFADPQVLHRKMVIEMEHPTEGKVKQFGVAIKLSDTPGQVRSLPVELGEHTEEILKGLGYTKKRISELRREGAIG